MAVLAKYSLGSGQLDFFRAYWSCPTHRPCSLPVAVMHHLGFGLFLPPDFSTLWLRWLRLQLRPFESFVRHVCCCSLVPRSYFTTISFPSNHYRHSRYRRPENDISHCFQPVRSPALHQGEHQAVASVRRYQQTNLAPMSHIFWFKGNLRKRYSCCVIEYAVVLIGRASR